MLPKAPKHNRIKPKRNIRANAEERRFFDFVARMGCMVCTEPSEIHHVTTDGYKRLTKNHFHVTPLCPEHHRGDTGIHKLGHKTFTRTYGIDLHQQAPVVLDLYRRKDH